MENESERREKTEEPSVERTRTPRSRVHTRYILPSDRHSFEVHFDILRRFVSHSHNGTEPISASRVEGQGIPVQAASMNVRFMRDIGLLEMRGRGQYVPTQESIRFVTALSVGRDKAMPILRGLLSSMWFTELAQSLFAARPVISEDEFLGELALASVTDMQAKGPALQVILEYLVYTGIVERDERGLSLASGMPEGPQVKAPTPSVASGLPANFTVGAEGEAPAEWQIVQTEDFYVKVRSDPDAFEDLSDHLELLKKKMWRLHKGKALKAEDLEEEEESSLDLGLGGETS